MISREHAEFFTLCSFDDVSLPSRFRQIDFASARGTNGIDLIVNDVPRQNSKSRKMAD
jgi:hypothetical protein